MVVGTAGRTLTVSVRLKEHSARAISATSTGGSASGRQRPLTSVLRTYLARKPVAPFAKPPAARGAKHATPTADPLRRRAKKLVPMMLVGQAVKLIRQHAPQLVSP